jgi:hypothetical protein
MSSTAAAAKSATQARAERRNERRRDEEKSAQRAQEQEQEARQEHHIAQIDVDDDDRAGERDAQEAFNEAVRRELANNRAHFEEVGATLREIAAAVSKQNLARTPSRPKNANRRRRGGGADDTDSETESASGDTTSEDDSDESDEDDESDDTDESDDGTDDDATAKRRTKNRKEKRRAEKQARKEGWTELVLTTPSAWKRVGGKAASMRDAFRAFFVPASAADGFTKVLAQDLVEAAVALVFGSRRRVGDHLLLQLVRARAFLLGATAPDIERQVAKIKASGLNSRFRGLAATAGTPQKPKQTRKDTERKPPPAKDDKRDEKPRSLLALPPAAFAKLSPEQKSQLAALKKVVA